MSIAVKGGEYRRRTVH